MASSSSTGDLFEPSKVSSSVSADGALQFLEDHGFFYQGDSKIGKLVDELYEKDRARSNDARLDYFKPILRQDLRLNRILDHYPIEAPRFRFPWGTTPGTYYKWAPTTDPTVGDGLVAYMLGSGSQWMCRDGSQGLESHGEPVANGTRYIPDALLENYPVRELKLEEGGVLLVHTLVAHSAKTGRSIMLGLWKRQDGAPRNA